MVEKKEMGICPKCGSNNLAYLDSWIDGMEGENVIWHVLCRECNFEFNEYLKQYYAGYAYKNSSDDWEEFDENNIKITY